MSIGPLADWQYTRPRETEHNPYLDPRPAGSSDSIKGNRVTPYALLDTDAPGSSHHAPTAASASSNQNVYVVHADGGGEDLHIRLPTPGARVIEMPPEYRGSSGGPGPAGSVGVGGKGGRPRMGMSLSSGSRELGIEEGQEGVERAPVSPVMSQVTAVSEKSRQ